MQPPRWSSSGLAASLLQRAPVMASGSVLHAAKLPPICCAASRLPAPSSASSCPGQHGRDYVYPGLTDFQFAAAQGFTVIRLPFKWERLQPDLDAPLDAEEWQKLAATIALARQFKVHLILDPHNYARRRVRADD